MNSVPAAAPDVAAQLNAVSRDIDGCLLSDRRRLRRRASRLRRRVRQADGDTARTESVAQAIARLGDAVQASVAVVRERQRGYAYRCAPDLPFAGQVDALSAAITSHQVVFVSGATGSGKSTQLPQLCLALGRGVFGRIGHTQPRRIAARAIASRISEESSTVAGELAAHCVRFDDQTTPRTRIKVMTEGILLNEIQHDPNLTQYDTVIIDEVHERSLNVDLLLGYLSRILDRRADLKLIVTSAMLDRHAFEPLFPAAATCHIEGVSHAVETRYRPPQSDDDDDTQANDLPQAVCAAVSELDASDSDPADVLVFLPGEREIREVRDVLRGTFGKGSEILSLYGRLPAMQQARVFRPGPERRIILATNVAETSLTVPRVTHVIDSGLARVSRYNPRRKLQQLPIEAIDRNSADQRRGRCGRERAGICIRLYSEADYDARPRAVEPEILRANLADVILRLLTMGHADPSVFPFPERPSTRLLNDGFNVLQEIGAVDATRAITPIGRQLGQFPIDPRLARVLLAAAEHGCLEQALIIAAALSNADPRDRPHERRDAADRAHQQWADKRSDFLWFVNAWPFARTLAALPMGKRMRRARRHFLSPTRIREWVLLKEDLQHRAREAGLMETPGGGYKAIHVALATGFPSLAAHWRDDHYAGCRDIEFGLFPASVLHKRNVRWILAFDRVETARPYARLAARIDPQWLVQAAPHLIKRSYEAPHWDETRGSARITEIQRLFGLVLTADRVVELERVDATAARELMIDEGLVGGRLGETPEFLEHNLALVRRIQDLEARTRRRDLLAPTADRRAFYAARIAPAVCSRKALKRWLNADAARPAALFMTERDAAAADLDDVPMFLFPETLEVAGTACPVRYRFAPGEADDGMTVQIPMLLLDRVDASELDRLVPGLLSEKVERLLRSLPKVVRRHYSPAREFAMAAVEALAARKGALLSALAAILGDMTGHRLDPHAFDGARLEAHLHCRIEVVDEAGLVVAGGRDLDEIRRRLATQLADLPRPHWDIETETHGSWCFGDIPERATTTVGTVTVTGYPGLAAGERRVALKVFDHAQDAARSHSAGLARLLLLNCAREIRFVDEARQDTQATLLPTLFGHRQAPLPALAESWCAQRVRAVGTVRGSAEWQALLDDARRAIVAELGVAMRRLGELQRRAHAIGQEVTRVEGELAAAAVTDIRQQLCVLVGPPVLPRIMLDQATHHDRYLDAVARRIERMRANPGKDLDKLARLGDLACRGARLLAGRAPGDRATLDLAEQFEEWRVGVFAPELGALRKVSDNALRAAVEHLEGAG